MTRYIQVIIASLIAVLLLAGCEDRSPKGEPDAIPGGFSLSVTVPLAGSRAAADPLNEYKVESLHLFFFREKDHDDSVSEYMYDVIVTDGFSYGRDIRLAFPDDCLLDGGLFGPDGDRCLVYAVANVDEAAIGGVKTLTALKNTVISSGFDKTRIQDRFMMDGTAVITLNRETRLATGTVSLERAAAKLTLAVDLPDWIDVVQTIVDPFDGSTREETVRYHSRGSEIHLWISNGVMKSPLNTAPSVVDEESLYSNEIYSAEGIGSAFLYQPAQPKYKYTQEIPFYSYPSKWDPFSPKGNCFLTLAVPWYYHDKTGATHNVVTYYRLNVQPAKSEMARNTCYDMRVTISRLGGTSIQTPVDMLFDWNYAMEWNVQTLPTDIKEIRYLLLNSNDYDSRLDAYSYRMENERSISIPYNSSHPVEIESVYLSWRDFKENTDRKIPLSPASGSYRYSDVGAYNPATDFAGITVDPTASTIELARDIFHLAWENGRAVIKDETALNAYTFTIRIRHTDADPADPASHVEIVVTQIPAIYITTQLTASGTRFINDNNTTYDYGNRWNHDYRGYLNSNAPNDATQRHYWIGSRHDEAAYVKNRNTYILSLSKFSEGDDYIIADPRTREVDNLNVSGSSAAMAAWSMADRNNNRLRNYYPADRSADKTRFIAPKLRVASQWGVTYQLYRDGAERRCASYQEDGRPAGRWRLPTVAEIEYISRLSNKQYIPYLFGSEGATANYWCASGGVDVNNDTENPSVTVVSVSSTDRRAVRCVYDEWFWGSDTLTNKRQFVWGDRIRARGVKTR